MPISPGSARILQEHPGLAQACRAHVGIVDGVVTVPAAQALAARKASPRSPLTPPQMHPPPRRSAPRMPRPSTAPPSSRRTAAPATPEGPPQLSERAASAFKNLERQASTGAGVFPSQEAQARALAPSSGRRPSSGAPSAAGAESASAAPSTARGSPVKGPLVTEDSLGDGWTGSGSGGRLVLELERGVSELNRMLEADEKTGRIELPEGIRQAISQQRSSGEWLALSRGARG